MQNVLNHISDQSSHLSGKRRKNFQHLVHDGYYTALSDDAIHDVIICLHLLMRTVQNVQIGGSLGHLGVTRGHRQCHHSIEHVQLPIRL